MPWSRRSPTTTETCCCDLCDLCICEPLPSAHRHAVKRAPACGQSRAWDTLGGTPDPPGAKSSTPHSPCTTPSRARGVGRGRRRRPHTVAPLAAARASGATPPHCGPALECGVPTSCIHYLQQVWRGVGRRSRRRRIARVAPARARPAPPARLRATAGPRWNARSPQTAPLFRRTGVAWRRPAAAAAAGHPRCASRRRGPVGDRLGAARRPRSASVELLGPVSAGRCQLFGALWSSLERCF